MQRLTIRAGFALVPVALAACGAGEPAEAPSIRIGVDAVDGVERWVYAGHGGPALAWSADTLAVIGGAEVEDDAYHFDQVAGGGLAADDAGRLYVLDRAASRVLVYDVDGRHRATHGRAGGGPGELVAPAALALGPGDSIWVADVGGRRYTVFPRDGGEARSVPFPEPAGFPLGELAIRGGAPIQAYRALRLRQPGGGPSATPPPEPPRTILRLDPSGRIADTLWVTQPARVDEVRAGAPASGRMLMIRTSRAFEAEQQWQALSDGSIVVSDTADYVLRLVRPDGTVLRRVDRDMPARETSEADRELARRRLSERSARGGGIRIVVGGGGGGGTPAGPSREELLEAQLAAMTFAPVIPRITGVRVDPLDRIWVGVSLDEPGTTARIDVYDREGNLLGELHGWELPDVFLGPSRAARLDRDEFDVQRIVLYRVLEDGGTEG